MAPATQSDRSRLTSEPARLSSVVVQPAAILVEDLEETSRHRRRLIATRDSAERLAGKALASLSVDRLDEKEPFRGLYLDDDRGRMGYFSPGCCRRPEPLPALEFASELSSLNFEQVSE